MKKQFKTWSEFYSFLKTHEDVFSNNPTIPVFKALGKSMGKGCICNDWAKAEKIVKYYKKLKFSETEQTIMKGIFNASTIEFLHEEESFLSF